MNYRMFGWLALAAIFLVAGCKSAAQRDHLLGRWQVKDIVRDGQSVVGPGFHGSEYLFQEDGKVLSWTYRGDSTTTEYSRRGDTLFWVTPEKTDFYLIDSLSETYMRFNVDQDGFQSRIVMEKVKTE